MKRIIKIFVISICTIAFTMAIQLQKVNAQPVSVSMQVFYDDLAPYGQWMEDPAYGYVWIPSAGMGFQPYFSDGYWVMTEYGNMWVSEYPWGWAPFHYGRWTYDNYYGWIWIPGTVWGPAWVTWRSSPGYYGWAPLGPGVTVSMAFNSYYPPNDWWVFIPPTYIHNHHWHRYYHGPRENTVIIHQTTIVHNSYTNNHRSYITGPNSEEIRHITHRDVPVYQVQNESRPGRSTVQNNAVNIYRPSVEKTDGLVAPRKSDRISHEIGKPEPVNAKNNRFEKNQKKSGRPDQNRSIEQQPNRNVKGVAPEQQQRSDEQQRQSRQPQMREQKTEVNQKAARPAQRKETKQGNEQRIRKSNDSKRENPKSTKKEPHKK